eukprot:2966352-Prymnesium_polylepis.1
MRAARKGGAAARGPRGARSSAIQRDPARSIAISCDLVRSTKQILQIRGSSHQTQPNPSGVSPPSPPSVIGVNCEYVTGNGL